MDNFKYILHGVSSAIIPGSGQILKGHLIKGLLIIIVGGVIGFLLAWTAVVPIFIWAWNIYDAMTSENEISFKDDDQKWGF